MIRKATEKDIDYAAAGYEALLLYEQLHGTNTNWVLHVYPTRDVAERACAAGTLYVWEDDQGIGASMLLNQLQPEDYGTIDWAWPATAEEVYVVHTLCVPPDRARQGLGRQMMEYAFSKAKDLGGTVMRLDTWAGNKPAAALYRKLGFRYAGKKQVLHEGVIPEELIFFEKQL